MSSKIDERVVGMRFDNGQFEAGIAETTSSLGKLKDSLSFNDVPSNIEKIANGFSAFGAVAFSALNRLTNSAIDFGTKIASSVLDPLIEGGNKRALNIEQARFQFQGLGMDVDSAMASALAAVKGTAYGLDEAAVAAAQFGASGISAGDEMTNALRGISGVAAMTGASYSDIADVFTKVAGQGRVMGDDLNRLGARGVNAAATLAKAMGTTEEDIRKMVSEGKISFQDFARIMNETFGDHATQANQTYSGSLANMRAALSRIGAAFAGAKFEQQRDVFNALSPVIDAVGESLKPLISLVNEFGRGKADGIIMILNALNLKDIPNAPPPIFRALANILDTVVKLAGAVKSAFTEIFPPITADTVNVIARAIEDFTNKLVLGKTQIDQFKRIFAGVFAVLDIGWEIIKNVARAFGTVFDKATEGAGGFLEFTAKIGDWLVKARDAIKQGNIIGTVLDKIATVASKVIGFFTGIGAAAIDMFNFSSWEEFGNKIGAAFGKVGQALAPLGQWISEVVTNIKNALKILGKALADGFQNIDWANTIGLMLGALSTGMTGGIVLLLGKLVGLIKQGIGVDFTGGFMDSLKGAFSQLTDTLGSMQDKLKAETLKQIAIAIAILAAAVLVLSFVDPAKLAAATVAVGVMAAEMAGAMKLLEKATSNFSAAKMAAVSGSMIGMATALLILASAVSIMGHLDWNQLATGLTGVAVGLGLMVGAMALLVKIPVAKTSASAGSLILMSTALVIFASALKILSTMDWVELAKGMSAVAVGLGLMVAAAALMNKATFSPLGALAMIGMAVALGILSGALKVFSTMSWDDIGRSLTVLAGALLGLSLAVAVMANPSSVLGAAAMIGVALAVTILTGAMKIFSKFSWEEIAKSMVMLGGSLAILAGAMAIMGIPLVALGGLALLVVSVGLMALAPALVLLGTMSWDAIGRGLTMLAASLAIMAVLGILLIPASVGFLLLGAGIALLGAGVLMAGEGLAMFGLGLAAVVAAVAIGTEPIRLFFQMIIDQIPAFMIALAQGLIDFGVTLANGATQLTESMGTLLQAILDAINNKSPQIIDTLGTLLLQLLDRVEQDMPQWVDKGGKIIISFLDGLNAKMPGISQAATRVIITFIQQIGNSASQIAEAGAQTIIRFINSLANTIQAHSGEMRDAGGRLAFAIADGMSGGLLSGAGRVIDAAVNMASRALNAAKNFLGIHSPSREFMKVGGFSAEGMANGLLDNTPMVEKAATQVGNSALTAMQNSLNDLKSGINTNFDMNPTIKPVLDLSAINQGSKLIGGILTPPTLKVDDSYAYASSIAASQRQFEENQNGSDSPDNPPAGTVVNFTQINNSPKELSAAEIYRNTNNQLSVIQKGGAPVA